MYRVRKFARRYRAALLATAAVLAAVLAGAGVSVWQAVVATRARTAEQAARQQAEENYLQARDAVDHYLTLVSESELLDVPGLQPLREELLESACRYYQRFLDQRSNDPGRQADLALACFRLAQVKNALDANDEALAAMRQGLDVIAAGRREIDQRLLRERLAGIYKGGRGLHRGTREPADPAGALRTLGEAAALWDQFVRDDPVDARLRHDLAGLNLFRGDLLRGLRQFEESLAPLSVAAGLWESLSAQRPDDPEFRAGLARCQAIRSDVLRSLKRPDEARSAADQSLALREALVREHPDVRPFRLELAASLDEQGRLLVAADRQAEASAVFARAGALLVGLTREFPGVPVYLESLATHRYEQARLSRKIADHESAEAAYRDAIAGLEHLSADYPGRPRYSQQLATYARNFALFLYDRKRTSDADAMYAAALAQWSRLAHRFPDEADYPRLLAHNLALAPSPGMRDPNRALSSAQRAAALRPQSASVLATLGLAQLRAGRPSEARTTLLQAVERRGHPRAFEAYCLAVAATQLGDAVQARQWYDRAEAGLKTQAAGADTRRMRREAAELLHIGPSSASSSTSKPSKSSQPQSMPKEPKP
jgi:serine/threonine-protein kinase